MDTNFKTILLLAKSGNPDAITQILEMYDPLLKVNAMEGSELDEDLYQELCIVLLNCIRKFEI